MHLIFIDYVFSWSRQQLDSGQGLLRGLPGWRGRLAWRLGRHGGTSADCEQFSSVHTLWPVTDTQDTVNTHPDKANTICDISPVNLAPQ